MTMKRMIGFSAAAVLAGCALFLGAASAPAPGAVTITGKITTGMMAIGGETTGITISDGKNTFELDIKDAVLLRKADELNGRQVTVTGTLTVKAGIEVKQRQIIAVKTLVAAGAATGPATRP
jgi:hypothetical protein